MTQLRLLIVGCLTLVALASPQVALGEGPQTSPRVLVTEGFETTSSANYTTSAYVNLPDQNGAAAGYWGRWTYWHQGGANSLWCGATNPTAVTAHKYAQKSAGHVTFQLPMTSDYYSVAASFFYRMPSLGDKEKQVPAFVPQWAPTPNPGYYQTGPNPAITSALGAFFQVGLTPDNAAGGLSLSRRPGEFRLQWEDQHEIDPVSGPPLVHTAEGPSVDDVVIAGWKYGPVRSLVATGTFSSTTLTWMRPWRSTAGTSTEERPLSFRVWRARAGTQSWIELTSPGSRPAATGLMHTFTDSSVPDANPYDYLVQAWDTGVGTGYGEPLSVHKVDTVGPRLVSARSSGARSVELRFSEPVDPATVALTDFRSALRLTGTLKWSGDRRRVRISTLRQLANPTYPYTVSLRPAAIADMFGNTSVSTTPITLRR